MRTKLHVIGAVVCLAFVGVSQAPAGIRAKAEAGPVAMVVSKLLEERHYNAKRVDDAMSREMLKAYLNALDYNHIFFRQSDVEKFQTYADTLDDELILGNIQPAFEIYAVYSNRVEETVATIKELLKQDHDFTKDESLVLDRHESPWAKDEAEWRDLIRQRVKSELLDLRLAKEKPEEATKTITRRYDRVLRSLHENDADIVVDIYLNALASLFDPHTQYMGPSNFDNFTIDMRLSLSGIGAVLGSEDGYAKILNIVPGGPADIDKRLKVNDRIVAVGQGDGPLQDVVDMKLNKVVEQIRGKKGTIVRLKFIPADAPDSSTRMEISLVRDEIKLTEQEAKAKIIEQPLPAGGSLKLGYVDLPSFYADTKGGPNGKSSSRDVSRLLQKMEAEKVDGVILDLRRNTGGSLQEAIALTGLFIDEGPVVQVKDPSGRVQIGTDQVAGCAFEGPLVVLTSHISASASEILAGALQDYDRALIVGDSATFGKGTVQNLVELDPYLAPYKRATTNNAAVGALKLTIQKFYRVSGGSTQFRGVIPDLQLPSVLDASKVGESFLQHCLPYDEVTPATYMKSSRRPPPVEELRRRSATRVEQDPEYAYIREDRDRLRKRREDKTLSLLEAARLAEKQEADDRVEKRKQNREARKIMPPKTTEITLAGLDGKTNAVAITKEVLKVASENANLKDGKPAKKDEPAKPEPDPFLDEGLRIMADYIHLLGAVHVAK